jgi:heptosyltransferase-2
VGTLLRGPHRPVEGGPPAAEQLAAPLAGLALFLDPGEAGEPCAARSAADAPCIALHPGSGSPRKNWGLDNWARLAATLHRDTGASMLVVAGEAEAAVLADFRALLDAAGIEYTLADSVPLPALAARLAGCRLFLGHDTGPAHLAAACGVPCVLVFGPTDPLVWAPAGTHVRVVRAEGHSLASVTPDQVVEAVHEILRGD